MVLLTMLTACFFDFDAETENENGSDYEDFESPSDDDTVVPG